MTRGEGGQGNGRDTDVNITVILRTYIRYIFVRDSYDYVRYDYSTAIYSCRSSILLLRSKGTNLAFYEYQA